MLIWKNLELLKALMKETTQTNEFKSAVLGASQIILPLIRLSKTRGDGIMKNHVKTLSKSGRGKKDLFRGV